MSYTSINHQQSTTPIQSDQSVALSSSSTQQPNNAAQQQQQQQSLNHINNTLLSQHPLYSRLMAPPHMSMIPSSYYSPQTGTSTLVTNNQQQTNQNYLQPNPQQSPSYPYLNNNINNNTLSMNVMMPSTLPIDYNILHQQQFAQLNSSNGLYGNTSLLMGNNSFNMNQLNNIQQSNPSLQSTQPNNNTISHQSINKSLNNPASMQQHLNLLQQLTNNQSVPPQQSMNINRQLSGPQQTQQPNNTLLPMSLLQNNQPPSQQSLYGTQSLYSQYNIANLQRTTSNTNTSSTCNTQPMNINQITNSPNWHQQANLFMNDNHSRSNTISPIADSTAALAQAMQARAESLAIIHGANSSNYNNNNALTNNSGCIAMSDIDNIDNDTADDEGTGENRVITAGGRKMKTGMQSKILKAFYTKQQRPSKDDVQALVNLSALPYHEISRWFRNERHKDKKSREAKTAALSALNRPTSANTVSTASPQVKPVTNNKKLKLSSNNHMDTANGTINKLHQTSNKIELVISKEEIDAQNVLINGISDAAQKATQSDTIYTHHPYKAVDDSSSSDGSDNDNDHDDDNISHSSNDSGDDTADQSSPDNGDKPMKQTEINTVDTLSAHQLSHHQATIAENVRNGNDSPIKPPDNSDALSVAEIDKLHGTTSPADKQFMLQPTVNDAWNYLNKLFTSQNNSTSNSHNNNSNTNTNNKRKRDPNSIDDDMLNGLVALFKPHRAYLKRICDQLLPSSPVANLI